MISWVEDFRREVDYGSWTLRPPASFEEIESLNEFLGFTMPNDLKTFLTMHNGLYGDNNGWEFKIVSSVQDIELDTKEIRASSFKFAHLGDVNTIIQIGYEPNSDIYTIYKCKSEKKINRGWMQGIYHCIPQVADQSGNSGYFEFISDNLESFIRSQYIDPYKLFMQGTPKWHL